MARALAEFIGRGGDLTPGELRSDRSPIVERRRVAQPLPELAAADLGRRGILHEPADRNRALATEPALDVLERHADVRPQAARRDRARTGGEVEERRRATRRVPAATPNLMWASS